MTRTLMALTAFVSLTAAYSAQACDTQLALNCQATYLASGKAVLKGAASEHLADENWDEPSEANCAVTTYMTDLNNTSVRVSASLENSQVTYASLASQVYKTDQNTETADYSNTLDGRDKVGNAVNLGILHLANPVSYGTQMVMVTDVAVTCTVH